MHSLVGVGVRGVVILASAVVLGLSVTLAKQQNVGSPPPETSFGSFTGAFGIITAAVGIAALFFDFIPTLVPLVADGLTALFFLAGGIALAVAMKGVSCTDGSDRAVQDRYLNKILNGGCTDRSSGGYPICGIVLEDPNRESSAIDGELKNRCTRAQADFAFQFISFAFTLGALAVTWLISRRS